MSHYRVKIGGRIACLGNSVSHQELSSKMRRLPRERKCLDLAGVSGYSKHDIFGLLIESNL